MKDTKAVVEIMLSHGRGESLDSSAAAGDAAVDDVPLACYVVRSASGDGTVAESPAWS